MWRCTPHGDVCKRIEWAQMTLCKITRPRVCPSHHPTMPRALSDLVCPLSDHVRRSQVRDPYRCTDNAEIRTRELLRLYSLLRLQGYTPRETHDHSPSPSVPDAVARPSCDRLALASSVRMAAGISWTLRCPRMASSARDFVCCSCIRSATICACTSDWA